MKKSGMMGIFTALLGGALFSHKERGLNKDPQIGRKGKSKGGGRGRGTTLKSGRPLPFGTPVGNDPNILQKYPFAWLGNWHEQNRGGFRGPRLTGHARRKCWR